MPSDLTLVVVAASTESLRQFPQEHADAAELVLVANTRGESLASIGNRYLDAARTEIFGLTHADVIFKAGALEAFTAAAQDAVCGIVGITEDDLYRWCWQHPGPVQTLDSCSVFFSRASALRFDARRFDGFHCHVQDLCMEAHRRKIPVTVPPADATHVGLNFDQPAWRADYQRYKEVLSAKWLQTPRMT